MASLINKLEGRAADLRNLLIILLTALAFRLININSNPPGLQGDELFNIIDALSIGSNGWPLYFPGNNGREVLFFYPVAFFLAILGQSVLAARLTAVLFGTGSVVLCYLIGKLHFSRRVGLAAATLMAVSLWPILSSRWVLRAVSLSFFSALTILFLTLCLRQQKAWRWAVLSGISLGLTLYTYIPARLFPLVVAGWLVWILLLSRSSSLSSSPESGRRLINRRNQVLTLFGVAILTFLPFGIYIINNWSAVNNRINDFDSALSQAMAGDLSALIVPAIASLKLFTVLGDLDWRYHVSGRPAFNFINGSIFYFGCAIALWQVARREETRWGSFGLMLIWLIGMLAPNMVLDDRPTFLRFAGGVVPTFLLFGIGFDHMMSMLQARQWLSPRLLQPVLPLLVLITALQTGRDLFVVWPNQAEVREIYQAELREIAQYLDKNPPPDRTRIVIAESFVYDAPTVIGFEFYSDHAVDWVSHFGGLLLPTKGSEQIWYFVPETKPLDPAAESLMKDQTAQKAEISYPNGEPAFVRYTLDLKENRSAQIADLADNENELSIRFEDGPQLSGYTLPSELILGQQAAFTLRWTIPNGLPPLANQILQTRIILEDGDGAVWGQSDHLFGFPQAGWQASDLYYQTVSIDIPTGIPPKPLYFRIELKDSNEQLRAVLEGSDSQIGPMVAQGLPVKDFARLSKKSTFASQSTETAIHLTEARYSSVTSPGIPLNLAFDWVVEAQPSEDLLLNIALVHPRSGIIVKESKIPWQTIFPPSAWESGTQISTQHKLILDQSYRDPTPLDLELSWIQPDDQPLEAIQLEADALPQVEVAIRAYLFEPPPIDSPVSAQFGENISLLGYALDESNAKAGGSIDLTLYWRALETPSRAYTVFNHIRNGPGGDMMAQLDAPPMSEAWATATWLPGEVIVDQRVIPISPDTPAGTFSIYVGLYSASDLIRTPVLIDGVSQADDQLYLADVTIR